MEKKKKVSLIFTTEGYFLNKLIHQKNNNKIEPCTILLDEVHERSFSNDILLGTLKNLDENNKLPKKMKVILCSATVNLDHFCKFFNNLQVLEI